MSWSHLTFTYINSNKDSSYYLLCALKDLIWFVLNFRKKVLLYHPANIINKTFMKTQYRDRYIHMFFDIHVRSLKERNKQQNFKSPKYKNNTFFP